MIAGALETLRRFRPTILMEIHGRFPLRCDFDPGASVVALAGLGYRFFDLDRRDDGYWCEHVRDVIEPIREAHKAHDVLCWHPEGPVSGTPPGFGIEFSRTHFGT